MRVSRTQILSQTQRGRQRRKQRGDVASVTCRRCLQEQQQQRWHNCHSYPRLSTPSHGYARLLARNSMACFLRHWNRRSRQQQMCKQQIAMHCRQPLLSKPLLQPLIATTAAAAQAPAETAAVTVAMGAEGVGAARVLEGAGSWWRSMAQHSTFSAAKLS